MKSIRVGFDGRYINDRYHGIGRYAFGILEALTRLAPETHFMIYRGQSPNSRFDWEGLSQRANVSISSGPKRLYSPAEQITWPRLVTRDRLDIFHSPYITAPWFLHSNTRVVITVHDLIFDRYPAYMPHAWSFPYYKLIMQFSTQRANRIVAVSKATANDLENFYRHTARKVTIAGEGVDRCFSPWGPPEVHRKVREKYHLNGHFILTVGARRPHKNHARLLAAYAQLTKNIPHQLVFVGPSDARFQDEAQDSAQRYHLNGRVKFLDWVAERDLPALYRLADLVVLPSLIEGFGLPALEAMACGTPVVAGNSSSYPEIVGEAARLVNPESVDAIANSIKEILNNPVERKRIAMAGVMRAQELSWEAAATQLLETYEEVLK
jgi:glycosyltransferase involved in cell wall biosynthesis